MPMVRPFRIFLSLCAGSIFLTLLLYTRTPTQPTELDVVTPTTEKKSSVQSLFGWSSPSMLFPPTAIISLTDDNSTFFLARPADFGPSLPLRGLSGPLWTGSTFSDDVLIAGDLVARVSGELGCSDIPGWDEDQGRSLRRKEMLAEVAARQPRDVSKVKRRRNAGQRWLNSYKAARSNAPRHADIQSLQEEGEISGKVVLLSRGGCGFLEKTMWAQRRGAQGLIVGDNVRGGPLITMYARGDTSNVTIPALFTSHTTAHLLSSLMPNGAGPNAVEHRTNAKAEKSLKLSDEVVGETSSTTSEQKSIENLRGLFDLVGLSRRATVQQNQGSSATSVHSLEAAPGLPLEDLVSGTEPQDSFNVRQRRKEVAQGGENDLTHSRETSDPQSSWFSWLDDSPVPEPDTPVHEGVWVTLSPTSMSSSPFFDTLLVLVISPLITLTVVYALLLLRSRIRRRRWRAPKSVVERLPVRTYHTLSSQDTSPSSSMHTPVASTPTTPLLASAPRPVGRRSRPRSQTTPDNQASSSYGSPRQRDQSPDSEKREAGLAEWRRRYGGRQKECVVCLEEYEDGISQVMSLPCGHEFHADCITPWLTTRRRTCPICKGDVVRSLARQSVSPSSLFWPHLHHDDDNDSIDVDDEEELQAAAANRRNDAPEAQMPIDEAELHVDLETGAEGARVRSTEEESVGERLWAAMRERWGRAGWEPDRDR